MKSIQISDGTLILNQEQIPFSITGERLDANTTYSARDKGYENSISLSLLSARWRDVAPQQGDINLQLLLRGNEAVIKSLHVSSLRSTLEAKGTLENLNYPELQLQYEGALDLLTIARMARISEINAGHADVKGLFHYQDNHFSSQGNVSLRNGDRQDDVLHLRDISAFSPFSITPEKIIFPKISGHSMGGNVEGEFQLLNRVPRPRSGKPRASPRH